MAACSYSTSFQAEVPRSAAAAAPTALDSERLEAWFVLESRLDRRKYDRRGAVAVLRPIEVDPFEWPFLVVCVAERIEEPLLAGDGPRLGESPSAL